MKLVYKCLHCGLATNCEIPKRAPYTVDTILAGIPGTLVAFDESKYKVASWIRHECEPGIHGIAYIAAVIE